MCRSDYQGLIYNALIWKSMAKVLARSSDPLETFGSSADEWCRQVNSSPALPCPALPCPRGKMILIRQLRQFQRVASGAHLQCEGFAFLHMTRRYAEVSFLVFCERGGSFGLLRLFR